MDKKHYYVQNGKLIKAADRAVPKILVGSADDLELIKDKVTPGSEAHTPGYANVWELSPERKWKSKVFADEDRLYDELIKMQFSEITADVKSIGSWAFDGQSNLVTAIFPECKVIGGSAFTGCSNLTVISFPKAQIIENYAFMGCSGLADVSFPEVQSIESYAFSRCTALNEAVFPKCETISRAAFSEAGLVSLYLTSDKLVTVSASPGINSTAFIYVPRELLSDYQTASYWSAYSSQFQPI